MGAVVQNAMLDPALLPPCPVFSSIIQACWYVAEKPFLSRKNIEQKSFNWVHSVYLHGMNELLLF